ncbi:MAG: hypothetical protein JSW11_00775, partial [Candidatus Heimdallarchaeota archaeon]
LSKIFRRHPINVYEHGGFEPDEKYNWDGKPGWLDICIELPPLPIDIWYSIREIISWIWEFRSFPREMMNYFPGFHSRWIFTVLPYHDILNEMSLEDAHTMLYSKIPKLHTKDFLLKIENPNFHRELSDNLDEWIGSNPIVEFDNIYTAKEFFTRDDVIKYTKLWIRKWYPKLNNRKIQWKEIK